MAQNKKIVTPENITEWLASTGFLLPRNEIELARFEKLYGDTNYGLTGNEIDPDKIINNNFSTRKVQKTPDSINQNEMSEYRMAARNGKDVPKHILDKIIKNQAKNKNDSPKPEDTNQ
jgi:hypothetical protein